MRLRPSISLNERRAVRHVIAHRHSRPTPEPAVGVELSPTGGSKARLPNCSPRRPAIQPHGYKFRIAITVKPLSPAVPT